MREVDGYGFACGAPARSSYERQPPSIVETSVDGGNERRWWTRVTVTTGTTAVPRIGVHHVEAATAIAIADSTYPSGCAHRALTDVRQRTGRCCALRSPTCCRTHSSPGIPAAAFPLPHAAGAAENDTELRTAAKRANGPVAHVAGGGYFACMDIIDWLLDSDPAIRWQAMRDLTDAGPAAIAAERARVAHEGLGAEILARQDPDGSWHRGTDPVWVPTLYTLLLLRATGVDPADPAVDSAVTRLAAGFRWDEEFGKKPFFEGEVEPCINGGTLALGGYFGRPADSLARRLLGDQLDDGGWNCEAPNSARTSFHSMICVLEGLLEYERALESAPKVTEVRRRGEAYLLERGLFRRRSTGDVVAPSFLRFAFPARCYYDVLRGLDYLRDAGVTPDARVDDAIRLVEGKRQPDGTWLLDGSHDDVLGFAFRESVGEPSRWNTLRALRVLRWYEKARPETASQP